MNSPAELEKETRERKRAEATLLRQKQFSDEVINSLPGVFYMLDHEGRMLRVNSNFLEVSGYSHDEVAGMGALDFVVEDDRERIAGEIRRGFELGDISVELEFVTKSGEKIPYSFTGHRADIGDNAYLIGVGSDISERKERELQLRKFASIVASTDDAIISKSLTGIIESWNRGAERLFGYTAQEAIGRPIQILIPDEHLDEEAAVLARIARGEGMLQYETVRRHKDGRLIDVATTISPIFDDNGVVVGAAKIARDITERRKLAEQLRQNERRLNDIYESVSDCIEIISMDGIIVDMNRVGYDRQGYTREEMVGKKLSEFATPEYAPLVVEHMAQIKKHGHATFESARKHKDGTIIPLEINSRLSELDGQPVFLGVSRDITDRIKAERVIRELNRNLEARVVERTARLEAANKDLEGFSYSISHDLRSPLRAISGFSEILMEEYADSLDAEGRRLLNVVSDNAQKMGGLIDDILDFSRAGRNEIAYTTIDMRKMTAGVWSELEPGKDGRHVHLDLGDIPLARGDSAAIRQVVLNLLSNALKFTQPRAEARIEVGGYTDGAENIYSVKDNGAGFDMRYASMLFGVFSRLHGADEFEGSGIGLAIVKRIVAKHGGRVWAEGKPDEGATFYFSLPIKEQTDE